MKVLLDIGLRSALGLAALHPEARALARRTEVVAEDIDYRGGGRDDQSLEVLRPRSSSATLPVLFFVHGGGFRILDRRSHRVAARRFADQGFVVVNTNYRLTPEGAYPRAVEDVAAALEWTLDNAKDFGGDAGVISYAGESAGANLVLVMALAGCYPREEAWAQAIFERDPRPRCVLPACGFLEVHNAERYLEDERLPRWIRTRIRIVCDGYLGGFEGNADMASPLRFLQDNPLPDRQLPSIFSICGDRDPVVEDSRRLGRVLAERGQEDSVRLYPGGHHAFHYAYGPQASRAWADQFAFLHGQVPEASAI